MTHYLLIAFGGALGATLRFAIGQFVQSALDRPWFPFATLFINIAGCFIFGVVIGLSEAGRNITAEQRSFILVGILGGFTTFSSFGYETFNLMRTDHLNAAVVNISVQVVLGIVGVWLGIQCARLL